MIFKKCVIILKSLTKLSFTYKQLQILYTSQSNSSFIYLLARILRLVRLLRLIDKCI